MLKHQTEPEIFILYDGIRSAKPNSHYGIRACKPMSHYG